jgi:hypothetical protein
MTGRRANLLCVLLLCTSCNLVAQEKPRIILRDTLDGKLDLSRFLIEMHGFIPVAFIITEPALGGFGVGVAPVFLKGRPPAIDTVRGKAKMRVTPPDISGFAGMYTINNSYMVAAFKQGTFLKARTKYRASAGFANINMAFYNTIAGEEQRTDFNLRTIPFIGNLQKYIPGTHVTAGIKYQFTQTQVRVESGGLPSFLTNKEIDSRVSMPGLIVDYDNRDNIFTPDKGYYVYTSLLWSNHVFGSDYDFENLNVYGLAYYPLRHNLIGGLRFEMKQVFGAPPFYMKPSLDLRGIPVMRYQGNIFSLGEAEFRWDFVMRWSAVFFAGTGKAYDEWSDFKDASWRTSGGAGFRYLVARAFKIRAGIDLARGPEQWAYYIVFGSTWSR